MVRYVVETSTRRVILQIKFKEYTVASSLDHRIFCCAPPLSIIMVAADASQFAITDSEGKKQKSLLP